MSQQPEQPTQPVQPPQPAQSSYPSQSPYAQRPPYAQQPPYGPQPQRPQGGYPQGFRGRRPQSTVSDTSSIQVLLLTLGIGLIVIAVASFASFAYTALGDTGRAVSIGLVGLITLAAGRAMAPKLRVTAEGLTWAGLIALAIDAGFVGSHHLVRAAMPGDCGAGLMVLTTLAVVLALRFVPDSPGNRPLRAYAIYPVFATPIAAMLLTSALPDADTPVWRLLRWAIVGLTAVLLALAIPADASSRRPNFKRLCRTAIACVVLGCASIAIFPALDKDVPLSAAMLAWLTVIAGWIIVLAMYRLRHDAITGQPFSPIGRVISTVGLVIAIAATSALVNRLVSEAGSRELGRTLSDLMVTLPMTAIVIICCVAERNALRRIVLIAAVNAPNATVPTTATHTSARITPSERHAAMATATLMLCIITFSEFDYHALMPRMVSLLTYVLMLIVTVGAWALEPMTQPIGPATASAMPSVMTSAMPGVAPVATPYVTPTPMPIATPLVASNAQPRPRPGIPPRRTHAASSRMILTCATVITGIGLFLLALDSHRNTIPADLITIVSGFAALAIGAQRMTRLPQLRSWPALWPGLLLTMVPSLYASWVEPFSTVRAATLLALSLGVLIIGVVMRWQAPLVFGAVILATHVVTVLWPWIAAFSRQYWWIWLGVGGIVFIVLAARYEASMHGAQTVARRISELR